MVAHTLDALAAVARLESTLVVLAPRDARFDSEVAPGIGPRTRVAYCGGDTRAATVARGLAALRERGATAEDWVLVHDAARCLLRPDWVDRLIDACIDDAVGGLLAIPVPDTIKSERAGRVAATLDRSGAWLAQTPQMFRIGVLQRALAHAEQRSAAVTDESAAVESLGLEPRLVPGDAENIKVTWPADFALAERLLRSR
jgi:2-C-methyl-D-erythritol 4-phosphate cytidylyltransferase